MTVVDCPGIERASNLTDVERFFCVEWNQCVGGELCGKSLDR
jgi:hypothetical protein